MDRQFASGYSPPRLTTTQLPEDVRFRKLSETTQTHYIRAVWRLAAFLGRSPDTATAEDLRNFQLYLVDHGVSPITLNATITGLKFLFDVTLDRCHLMAKIQPVKLPQTLPVVLSREEVSRLIAAAGNLKVPTLGADGRARSPRPLPTVSLRFQFTRITGNGNFARTDGTRHKRLLVLGSSKTLERPLQFQYSPDLPAVCRILRRTSSDSTLVPRACSNTLRNTPRPSRGGRK